MATVNGHADDLCPSIKELIKIEGNAVCADCQESNPSYASCSLGIFICTSCANIHKCLNPDINKVRSIDSDKWTKQQLQLLSQIGNVSSNRMFEKHVPTFYRRPVQEDPLILMEQWIRAKYERREFCEGSKPSYLCGQKDGYLWKRGKEDRRFKKRRFVLDVREKTLKYYNKEGASVPKAVLCVDKMNIFIAPEKIGNPNGMEIMFEQDNFTRSLFVYADDAQELIDWYTSIHSAKLQWLQIAFPSTPVEDLCGLLWVPIIKEGWLHKSGPRPTDAFRKRWVSLVNRKLLYYEDPLNAFPKGEVFIGSSDGMFSVGINANFLPLQDSHLFTLRTPERIFHFQAESEAEKKEWVEALQSILKIPVKPQDLRESTKKRTSFRHSMMSFIKS